MHLHILKLYIGFFPFFQAMLLYLMQVMRGVHGNVTNKDGQPISGALLRIAGRTVSFYTSATGNFWRILLPGDYILQV